jgi:hypothetical protein
VLLDSRDGGGSGGSGGRDCWRWFPAEESLPKSWSA